MFNIKGHADKNYERELFELRDAVTGMGERVLDLLKLTRNALEAPDPKLVEEAKLKDKEINKLDHNIEELATLIMTKRQPFMDELRFVASTIKLGYTLERMGDMAKNTVKRSAKLTKPIPAKTLNDLLSMADRVMNMIKTTLNLVVDYNDTETLKIMAEDNEVDDIYKSLFKNLQEDMMKNPNDIPAFTHVIFVAKNLERIGDYSTTFARIIYYINSGEKVKKKQAQASGN